MARSVRHTSIKGIGTAQSNKQAKVAWHRVVRHHNRVAVLKGRECALVRELTQVRKGPKDDKRWFVVTEYPERMRK